MSAWIIFLGGTALACALDLAGKKIFFDGFAGTDRPVFLFFSLTHHRNFGIIADIPVPLAVVTLVSLLVALAILIFFIRSREQTVPKTVALSLILGGALGNLFDRLSHGFVRDWLLLFGRSALNLADIFIGIGILLLWMTLKHPGDKLADQKIN